MNPRNSFLHRFVAMVLALVLLLSNVSGGIAPRVAAAETTKSAGQVVAENFSELTAAEKALLSSGYLAGETFTYTVPTSSDLITVDTESKKITAKSEGEWTPVKAAIVSGGAEKEVVTLKDGSAAYQYSGNSFSVRVTYEMKKNLSESTQTTLLNTAGWLKSGVATMDKVAAQRDNLNVLEMAMSDLMELASMEIKVGSMSVTLSDQGIAAIHALNNQMKANGGKLDLSVRIDAYTSGSKVEHTLKNGLKVRDDIKLLIDNNGDTAVDEKDTGYIYTLEAALRTLAENIDAFLSYGLSVDANTVESLKTLSKIVTKLCNGLLAVPNEWTAAEKGIALVSSNPNYAKLDELVGALGTITAAPAAKNPLVVGKTEIVKNLAMHDVHVEVILNAVNSDNKVAKYDSKTVMLTIAEGATATEVKNAVAENGIITNALKEWSGVYVEGKFTETASALPNELLEEISYTVTYAPKEYKVTREYADNLTVPYGYKLTLPMHSSVSQAYDYTVNGTKYAQGSVITIVEDTTITRTSGKEYTTTSLNAVVADNYGNDIVKAILKAGALKGNDVISARQPDSRDAEGLVKLEDGKIQAKAAYASDYSGLNWIPYSYGINGTETLFKSSDKNGDVYEVSWADNAVNIQYRLTLSNYSASKAESILKLAVQLKNDAQGQKETMDGFAKNHATMGQLDRAKLGALNGIVDVTDFTPGDGKEDDAKSLELRAYFKEQISGILAENLDTNNKLKIYNMLTSYLEENNGGLIYYYRNSAPILKEIEGLSARLSALLADDEKKAALEIIVTAAGYPEYADKIESLETTMATVKKNLTAPNSQIDMTSADLADLVEALQKSGTASYTTPGTPYLTSESLNAIGSNFGRVRVYITVGSHETSWMSQDYERGYVLSAAEVSEIQSIADAEVDALVGTDIEFYTQVENGITALSGTTIKGGQLNVDYAFRAVEYVVRISGEEDQIVTIENLKAVLPEHELSADGWKYYYTIGSKTDVNAGSYTFTRNELKTLFKDGVCTITRREASVSKEKFENAFTDVDGTAPRSDWEIVEKDGRTTGLNVRVPGTKDGIMGFVMDLVDSGYTHVELNGEPLLYMQNDATEVSLQTLVDAILMDNSFCSDTLIKLGKNGKGQLVASNLSLGNAADDIDFTDLQFTMVLTSAPTQMGSVSSGLKTIKPYIEYQSNNGNLDVQLNLPEQAYEIYLTALLACNEVDRADLNDINNRIAMAFLWDYVEIIKDSDATPTTLSNTLAMLGIDVDLTDYNEHYAMVKKLLAVEGVETESEENDKFDMKLVLKSKEAIDELFNFLGIEASEYEMELGMIKEYKNPEAGLEINMNARLMNVDSSYEALIVDFEKLQSADAKEKAAGYDFVSNAVERINALTGETIVMLLDDLTGNLTIGGNMILDLNGKTLTGNISVGNGAELIIVDSTLPTAGSGTVTGTISGKNIVILGGKFPGCDVAGFLKNGYILDPNTKGVRNGLYKLTEQDGNVVVTFDVAVLETLQDDRQSYISFAETAAVDLAVDLLMNYYTISASISYDNNGIGARLYNVNIEDLMEVLEESGQRAALMERLLGAVDLENVNSFINDILDRMMDFAAIAEAEKNNTTFASYNMVRMPRMVLITHVQPEDYLSFGITPNEDKAKAFTFSLEFDSDYMAELAAELAVVVDKKSIITSAIEDIAHTNEGMIRVDGKAAATMIMELSRETKTGYTTVIAVILGSNSDNPKAWADAANAGDLLKLQQLVDETRVCDVVAALVNASSVSFAEMADKIGIEHNAQMDAKADIFCAVLVEMGAIMQSLGYDAETAMMADYSQDNFYRFHEQMNAEKSRLGVSGSMEVDVDFRFKLFCVHEWDDGVVTLEPACKETGLKKYTCVLCGGCIEESVPAAGHTVAHREDKDPTCTEKGYENWTYCSVCGEELSKIEVQATGHLLRIEAAVAPTCTESGLTEGRYCIICGTRTQEQEVVPALGHTEETIEGHDATCTEDGLSDGKACSVCQQILVEQTVIPANGIHVDEEEPWHSCDVCGDICSTCVDDDQDGVCDICGISLGCGDLGKDHVDDNSDHKCDNCGKRMSWCRDCNRDHICDICGKTLTKCIDFNRNHICDICWTALGACEDEDANHRCDYCFRRLSWCKDADKDHACDICGLVLGACEDADRNGRCDICGADLQWVVRVAGTGRGATARKAADELKMILELEKFESIVYASGYNFPDALAGSYISNRLGAPVLLYYNEESAMNLQYILDNLSAKGTVYILGGPLAVPQFVERQLKSNGVNVVRLQGESRFETNLEILEYGGFAGGKTVLVCTGYEFADSLSASATGMPILLVNNVTKELRQSQIDYLNALPEKCNFILIGGTTAIGTELENILKAYDADGKLERVYGQNRFETSLQVAEKFFPDTEQAVLSYGWIFPDALCGGPIAYAVKAPVILTADTKIDLIAGYLAEKKIAYGYVMGGPLRLSDEIVCTAFGLESADQIHSR